MRTVEPIRDKKKLEAMKKVLKAQNLRDWLLFVLGINSGLRISDLLLEQKNITKKLEIIERIKRVSPIAWQHINLGGRFKLIGQKKILEIDLLINKLNDFLA